jgi:orotidine-5'-phosphate decarboxylase
MIIVAIDEIKIHEATRIINLLDAEKCMLKIGSVTFNALGHEVVKYASEKGFKIFLDLKLHDIPNTVSKSIDGLLSLPIQMLTIHLSGGRDMIDAAMNAVSGKDISIFGVTSLTSLDDKDCTEIYRRNTGDQVNAMLDLAESAGVDGVVCSPHELDLVKSRNSLLTITPGIRLEDSFDDQKRVMTPKEAKDKGADYLVIGRPITSSVDIKKTLNEIYVSIQ